MKNKYGIVLILGIILSLISISLFSDETKILIADDQNMNYSKPEVKYSPSGAIYVAYQADNILTGRSDIFLSIYEGGKVSFIRNISNTSGHSYEPEMDIRGNGDIHIAWCDQIGSNHYIKYSYFNGSNWSKPQTFGHVGASEIEDLRIAVDNSGNVFVVFMYFPDAKCKFISKYGNNVSFQDFPLSGRSKHPDVTANNDYIHITWQHMDGGYTIGYQRRSNHSNSRWESKITVQRGDVQRPRIDIDSSGIPHVLYQEGIDPNRTLYYEYKSGGRFTGRTKMSETGAYYYIDISAAFSNNVIISAKKGRALYYNWKVNNSWTGYTLLKSSVGYRPQKQSIDLDKNSLQSAIAYVAGYDTVYLVLNSSSGEIEPGGPIASFTLNPQSGHIPFNVEFDASGSSASNGTIVNWAWNFGDGGTASGQTASHTYSNKGYYIVTLTVTDSNGKSGSTSRTVEAIKINTPPYAFFTYSPKSGIYPLTVTFDPEKSDDSDGKIVKLVWKFYYGISEESLHKTSKVQVSNTYEKMGNYRIQLKVYDDENGSNSYSQSVFVYGVEAPVNVRAEVKENRTLFSIKYVTKLTWDNNQLNKDRGVNIVKYKIFRKRKEESNYSLIAEIDASSEKLFDDRIGSEKIEYDYKVVAVDDGGRESN